MAVGAANFALLRWMVNSLGAHVKGQAWMVVGLSSVSRLLLVAALLWLAVRQGFAAGLFAFGGYVLGHWPLVLWHGRRAGGGPEA